MDGHLSLTDRTLKLMGWLHVSQNSPGGFRGQEENRAL